MIKPVVGSVTFANSHGSRDPETYHRSNPSDVESSRTVPSIATFRRSRRIPCQRGPIASVGIDIPCLLASIAVKCRRRSVVGDHVSEFRTLFDERRRLRRQRSRFRHSSARPSSVDDAVLAPRWHAPSHESSMASSTESAPTICRTFALGGRSVSRQLDDDDRHAGDGHQQQRR